MRGLCGHDRMVVGFISVYAICAYHQLSCGFDSRSCQCVLDTILYVTVQSVKVHDKPIYL